jgi:hypothetical protein
MLLEILQRYCRPPIFENITECVVKPDFQQTNKSQTHRQTVFQYFRLIKIRWLGDRHLRSEV